ncbi:hypothetical protein Vadar_028809 [Vaccinium darrowii]|uniref:Uncharacterized protein n=1 Tax=Vaccinium darrowii TaxID=229202 RepID=A0ACB7Z9C3_9ERIC|nr:hypothetical protein Vadar_028809 [Vaccinium darrowii]
MDQTQQNRIQILGQFPKKPIQIILSISAFSILFSLSPLFPLFSNSIASFSSQIFSYTTDRNYIFLVCNGILAFLIKNSSTGTNQDRAEKIFDHPKSVPEVAEKRELVREEVVEFTEEKGKESEEKDEEDFIFAEEEEEEEEEEGVGLMSAEELNQKCEEFIRKMREGIKIEAQNKMGMAY